jgi:diguanylate cyclase (GGDEF)-like protein
MTIDHTSPENLRPASFDALQLVADPIAVVDGALDPAVVVAANRAFVRWITAARGDAAEWSHSSDVVGESLVRVLGGVADAELELVEAALVNGAGGAQIDGSLGLIERGTRTFEFRVSSWGELLVLHGTDVTDREALAARVAHEARHDPVTGLPNAAAFVERVESVIRRPELAGNGAAVVICDLDQYRTISDALGPLASGEMLRVIGERLERQLRFGDCVARLTGDEFAVLCCDVVDDDLTSVATRLVAALSEPVVLDSGEVYVSATAGVSRIDVDDAPERVLRDAHAALSKARRSGHGSVSVFDATVRDEVVARVELEKALHRALRRQEFRVFYQPLVRFAGAAVVGFEALVRWQHPERGLVAPLDFIPVAEETGLIVPIGAWVIDEVCRQAAIWQDQAPGFDPLVVSVNLSARQLAHPDLVSTIATAIARNRLDPATLVFEVTESTLMSDPGLAVTILHALRALGVRIAVDDFGTGHSSLGYLKQLPVDCLKIDRSFVSGLGVDPDDRAIVGAVVSMGHALGLTVTAEGVETLEQLDALESLGCDVGQGFYFAKPQPGDVVAALVRHRFSWRRAA